MTAGMSVVGGANLLPPLLPSTAARYACRCPIPFPRTGVATELAVCICTTDRDSDKSFPADAAGDTSAGGGTLTVRDGDRRACLWLARTCLGHNRDIPKPVIRRLGDCGNGGEGCGKGGSKENANAVVAHESNPRCA